MAPVVLAMSILLSAVLGWPASAPARAAGDVPMAGRPVYRPPTDAPVIDPFRPPPQPWLPGNRGIEYGTTAGAQVTAIGPGVVAFSGSVAGRLVVTIDHPDGLRSSYVGLAGVAVAKGARIVGGAVVGLAAGPLHLGVRRGDRYLDPALLWGTAVGSGRAILVPDGRTARTRTADIGASGQDLRRSRTAAGFLRSILAGARPER